MAYDPEQIEFSSDGEAVQFLEQQGYLCAHGAIIPPNLSNPPSLEESKAIDYLCSEWDWTFLD
jgi:hypothetical protein